MDLSSLFSKEILYVCNTDRPINETFQRLLINYIFPGIMKKTDVEITWSDTSKKISIKISDPHLAHLTGNKIFEFEDVYQIGSGSYGTINYLYCEEHQVELALKRESLYSNFGKKPIEEEISRMLLDKGCNTVLVKFIRIIDGESFYLMNKMEGNLEELAQKFRSDKTRNATDNKYEQLIIVEEIRAQILCIYNIRRKFVYTDCKLENTNIIFI